MPFLIGADEAGYGPNLGPLVVAATVWRVPEPCEGDSLYRRLDRSLCAEQHPGDLRLRIADSKAVYQVANGLGNLERGVLAAIVAQRRQMIGDWRSFFQHLDPMSVVHMREVAWYRDFNCGLPIACDLTDILAAAARLRAALVDNQIELMGIHAKVVMAHVFNQLVAQHGNKSHLLSWVTIELIRELRESLTPDEPVLILCDKHGGRNRYQQLLQNAFPETLVEVYRESRQESIYRMGPAVGRTEVRFSVGGERALPTALASMGAKYLRELAMRAFNAFWQQHQQPLKPCAGYPLDARRFVQEIAPTQQRLKISHELLWRCC